MKDPGLAGDTQPMKRSSVSDRTLGREPWAHPASAAARNLLGYSSSRCCSCTQQKAPRSGAATARTCEKELQVRDKTESTLQISCWIVLRQIIVLKNCAELKTRFLAQHQAVLSSRGTQQSGGDVQGELRAAEWGCWGSTVPQSLATAVGWPWEGPGPADSTCEGLQHRAAWRGHSHRLSLGRDQSCSVLSVAVTPPPCGAQHSSCSCTASTSGSVPSFSAAKVPH